MLSCIISSGCRKGPQIKSFPYKILGCMPQVVGKHESYDRGYRFVPIENY